MELSEASLFETARRRYERGRWQWALVSALPVLLLPLASGALGGRVVSQVVVGLALFFLVGWLLWRGQALGSSVAVGLRAGLIPLVLAHCARAYGHVCTSTGCASLCVPACALGGIAAGLWVSVAAKRSASQALVLAGGATTAFLVGALGCACVGFSALAAMATGVLLSIAVAGMWPAKRD